MIYGMQISASGVLTNMYRQDVLSNNLANINTVGFKPDIVTLRQRDPARVEDNLWNLPSNAMLERLGGGVLLTPNRISQTQGILEPSTSDLDLALEGEGFFVVASGSGNNTDRLRFTRDGRFAIDPSGRLVTASGGYAVLDSNDRPITLTPDVPFTIGTDGVIRQGGNAVATLQVATIPDPRAMIKSGDGLYAADAAAIKGRIPSDARVRQHMTERSAADPIRTMMGITDASSAIGANARMIQLFDELANRTINSFARIA